MAMTLDQLLLQRFGSCSPCISEVRKRVHDNGLQDKIKSLEELNAFLQQDTERMREYGWIG